MIRCPFCKAELPDDRAYSRHLSAEPPEGCRDVATAFGKFWPYPDKNSKRHAELAGRRADRQAARVETETTS